VARAVDSFFTIDDRSVKNFFMLKNIFEFLN
jgi:hypothetical protein